MNEPRTATGPRRRVLIGGGVLAGAGLALALSLVVAAEVAHAICGGFSPPPPPPPPPEAPGSIDPDSREPRDPAPPPDGGPSTGGGGTGGPTTGGNDIGGPTTPSGDTGGPTTGDGGASGPTTGGPTTGDGGIGGPSTGGGARPGRSGGGGGRLDAGHWTHWWYANRTFLLAEGSRARANAAQTPGSSSIDDVLWRAETRRALAKAMTDDDEEVVESSVLALGKAGDASDISLIMSLANDADRKQLTREAAAMSLGILRADTADDRLAIRTTLEAMGIEKRAPDRQRAIAILALGLRQDEASVPYLMDRAREGGQTWDVPAAGLTALGLSGSEDARGELVRLLVPPSRGNDSRRQVYAAHGLAKLRDPVSLPALYGALADKSDDVRRAAALAIGSIAPPAHEASVNALDRVMRKDKDRGVRATATVALGLIGGDSALATLRRTYDKDDAAIRPFAAVAIGVLARRSERPRIAAPLLKALKRGTRTELLGATCVAVGLAGMTDAAPRLREVLSESKDPKVKAQAAMSLGLIGDRDAAPPILREMLRESNDTVLRGEIARALGMLGDVRTLVELDDMAANGKTEHERITGLLGLGRIGGRESASLLTGVLGDTKRSTLERHMAGNAIGLLLDKSEGRRVHRVSSDLNWYALTQAVFHVMAEM